MKINVKADLPSLSETKIRASVRAALLHAAAEWHSKFLPEHFKFSAYSRYGYMPRDRKYEIRKARHLGHRKPLVYSGTTQQMAMSEVSFRSTSIAGMQASQAVMAVEDYFFQRPRNSPIDKAEELTTINEQEQAHLTDIVEKRFMEGIGVTGFTRRSNVA